MEKKIIHQIAQKGAKAEYMAEKVVKNTKLLPELFDGIKSEKAREKFGSAKVLMIISQQEPALIYSKWDFFVKLLDSDNDILKWTAIKIIANLTSLDKASKFEKIFKKYYDLLSEGSLITSANIVEVSAIIIEAKPKLADKIIEKILEVERVPLPTKECRNILSGKAILVYEKCFDKVKENKKVISFIKKQLKNTRHATKVKAEKFLEKLQRV